MAGHREAAAEAFAAGVPAAWVVADGVAAAAEVEEVAVAAAAVAEASVVGSGHIGSEAGCSWLSFHHNSRGEHHYQLHMMPTKHLVGHRHHDHLGEGSGWQKDHRYHDLDFQSVSVVLGRHDGHYHREHLAKTAQCNDDLHTTTATHTGRLEEHTHDEYKQVQI